MTPETATFAGIAFVLLFAAGSIDFADQTKAAEVKADPEAHCIVWDAEAHVYLYADRKECEQ